MYTKKAARLDDTRPKDEERKIDMKRMYTCLYSSCGIFGRYMEDVLISRQLRTLGKGFVWIRLIHRMLILSIRENERRYNVHKYSSYHVIKVMMVLTGCFLFNP